MTPFILRNMFIETKHTNSQSMATRDDLHTLPFKTKDIPIY